MNGIVYTVKYTPVVMDVGWSIRISSFDSVRFSRLRYFLQWEPLKHNRYLAKQDNTRSLRKLRLPNKI